MSNKFLQTILEPEVSAKGAIVNQDFRNENISNIVLQDFKFSGVNFFGCIFRNVDFTGSLFMNCQFNKCNFYDVRFRKTEYWNCSFRNTLDFFEILK